jgi:hypothetical protein
MHACAEHALKELMYTTLAAKLPPVSTMPVANGHRYQSRDFAAGVVDTGGK